MILKLMIYIIFNENSIIEDYDSLKQHDYNSNRRFKTLFIGIKITRIILSNDSDKGKLLLYLIFLYSRSLA
jgi:hypothetical protein